MPTPLSLEQRKQRALAKSATSKLNAALRSEESAESESPVPTSRSRRSRRNVFNGTEAKLSVRKEIPGYHLHVFTDTGGRIQDALDTGYEFVTPDEVGGVSENVISRNGDLGDRVRYLVNPRAEGTEQYGYLMKIREEWYEEDQANLQAKNNRIDAAIRKGKVSGEDPSFYIPTNGIKLT